MTERKQITVRGVVQGVGFRPFIYRLATEHKLTGFVLNSARGVIIEAQGETSSLSAFISDIKNKLPGLASIDSLECADMAVIDEKSFEIHSSVDGDANAAIIPADIAICPDCARDIADQNNRRYNYPFTNCTNCGPRFTIVRELPYDRAKTEMSAFPMCPDCTAEFENPTDRRFHAQPNACPVCGPQLQLNVDGKIFVKHEAAQQAAKLISEGKTVALKSLGGFQLACDALNGAAIARLRAAKNRPHKPFALMFADCASVRRFCRMNADEEKLFLSAAAPIVMLQKLGTELDAAAPKLSTIGAMAAYTPLHLVLFNELAKTGFTGPLVMTSANRRDEPIQTSAAGVTSSLSGTFDAVLDHNRGIHNRCDDSVMFIANGKPRLVRRARGFVPQSIKLSGDGPCVFGAGGQMKGAFCLTRGNEAFMSQHIGEMDEPESETFYLETLAKMQKLLGAKPVIAAHDLHPDYAATRIAQSLGIKTFAVQHHFAHAASVLAEHGIKEPVLAVVLDGTGLGPDGTVWGGEILLTDGKNWQRRGALQSVRLPGGDAAAVEIWRMGLAWAMHAFGDNWQSAAGHLFAKMQAETATVSRMAQSGFNSPYTTSMGRLFDAISFICGGPEKVSYEAQAAMEFEALAEGKTQDGWHFDIAKDKTGLWSMDPAPLIRAAFENPVSPKEAAQKFHGALSQATTQILLKLSQETGIKKAALSGGVFQNKLFLELAEQQLTSSGFELHTNINSPTNDGGIALGQCWAAILNN
jgi:hydrogenase maturation protein HypF